MDFGDGVGGLVGGGRGRGGGFWEGLGILGVFLEVLEDCLAEGVVWEEVGVGEFYVG